MKDLFDDVKVGTKRGQSRRKGLLRSPRIENGFIFRDGRGLSYRVEWTDRKSWLFAMRKSGAWMPLRTVESPEELDSMMEMEVDPDEYSLYEYEVEMIGRGFFMVRSASRPEIVHVVDLESNVFGEPPACSCEQNRFRKLPCAHLKAVGLYQERG